MKKVYICSPYRAGNSVELDRNIAYAQELTREAIDAGYAPITPHLYITQCVNDNKVQERTAGLAVGLELIRCCDLLIIGSRYGISEGMQAEIATAGKEKIETTELRPMQYAYMERSLFFRRLHER